MNKETEAAFLRPVGMVMSLSSSCVLSAWLPFLALALTILQGQHDRKEQLEVLHL